MQPARIVLVVSLILLSTHLAGRVDALDVSRLEVETVVPNIDSVIAITHAGDERLFLTLKDGRVMIYDEVSGLYPEPFLDIRDRVASDAFEQGLLSIAFHPSYTQNGFFYAYYTRLDGDVIISRFQVSPDPDRADATSESVLLRLAQPFDNHNGGQLQFGPDGFLYAGVGDGGSANDPQCNSQNGQSLLGKLLRLDVDQNIDQEPYHGIPAGNPFVGTPSVRDEIWALGLRNPWRFSFDRVIGDLYIADVGQAQREEVDLQPVTSGGGENYGWKMMEGNRCTQSAAGCSSPIPGCNAVEYTPPILEYDHSGDNCSITGGYIYRGDLLPDQDGVYFYGDYCSGQLWAAELSPSGWQTAPLAPRLRRLATFGEDATGELYLAAEDTVYRLVDRGGETCAGSPTVLCLNKGRFRVESSWRTLAGDSGAGQAQALTDESGMFWFFNPENIEIVVKVLNGCFEPYNHYWVFAAGLTNVEVELIVTDTATGQVKRYDNVLNTPFQPILDTQAFATCP